MSTLLSSLGRWAYRHPWRVIVAWFLALLFAGSAAVLLNSGTDDAFSIPGTESEAGLIQLDRSFPQVSGASAQLIVVAPEGEHVTDAQIRGPVEASVTELGKLSGVIAATSPFDELVTGMVSEDASAAIVRVQFDGQATAVTEPMREAVVSTVDDLRSSLPEGSTVKLGGDLFAVELPTVSITEGIGVLVALVVLVLTFASLLVAGLPLLTALIGVAISMAGIFAATAFATISSTTPLLALMLGLAVGIDYALFIVARHQDQVRHGMDPEDSTARATGTAGSAVVFAGITVLIALIGLSFAGIPFLTTMGIAAAVAVALAVIVSLTLTPALLGLVKGRIVGRQSKKARAVEAADEASDEEDEESDAPAPAPRPSVFARWVTAITRRPVVTSVSVVLLLGLAAIPASSLALALPNAGVLPQSSEARQAYDLTAEHFGPGFNGPLIMTGTIVTSTDPLGLMADLADDIERTPGVAEVALSTPNETADTGIVQVIPQTAPDDPATADLVRTLRGEHDRLLETYGVDLKVTGFTAVAIDVSDKLGAALVPFGLFVIGLSFVLLLIVFRSIWVPLTAALGYVLSVLAAFGVVAAVFEWGWFADALHVSRVGPIISFMPIVVMGVLFGLAMDYQVFLVSRMREDYVHGAARGRDAALAAVRSGFLGSAKVVTAAAIIMFAVFVAFVPEGDANIKPIALGLAVGVAVDAFLVRMTLIPALMAILGERAWQIPSWLDRHLPHLDAEGEAVERERVLAEWPADASIVAADDVEIDAEPTVVEGLSLRVGEGQALIMSGADAVHRRLVALALAGRTPITAGKLRVDGHLLPGRGPWVRAHVGLVLAGDAETDASAVLSQLREALRGKSRVVVIDGLDALEPAAADQAVAMLRDARRSRPIAMVATAADRQAASEILERAGWATPAALDLSRHAATTTQVMQ